MADWMVVRAATRVEDSPVDCGGSTEPDGACCREREDADDHMAGERTLASMVVVMDVALRAMGRRLVSAPLLQRGHERQGWLWQ